MTHETKSTDIGNRDSNPSQFARNLNRRFWKYSKVRYLQQSDTQIFNNSRHLTDPSSYLIASLTSQYLVYKRRLLFNFLAFTQSMKVKYHGRASGRATKEKTRKTVEISVSGRNNLHAGTFAVLAINHLHVSCCLTFSPQTNYSSSKFSGSFFNLTFHLPCHR